MKQMHSFHIPVMGIGYTIDTPLKVAHFGIDSVLSIGDDILLEKLRKMYCEKYRFDYSEITSKTFDFRAKRITAYLNLINELVKKKFDTIWKNTGDNFDKKKFIDLLPNTSPIKQKLNKLLFEEENTDITNLVYESLKPGSIDVNIMTKLDKENYYNGEKLPVEYNDAHAALRGYANSDLDSSIVFSAGMNPRLFSYLEQFNDFYPNKNGEIKKRIILKVSDYRSASIQGMFFAKKGLWISEFRIESGLNCGGHTFVSDGHLMGPILADFKNNRAKLENDLYLVYSKSLSFKNKTVPLKKPKLNITAQGGVGNAEEHQFLLNHYNLDSVGWGTPFLLVPEATNVDSPTLEKLIKAKEKDLYRSEISPLGVPFNNLVGNSKDEDKNRLILKGRPGSSCPKNFLALNSEFPGKPLCTASRQYQYFKINELNKQSLSSTEYKKCFDKIVQKSCICVGLGTSALIVNDLSTKTEGTGVSICPGPNIAYFSKIMTLQEIVDHIYGRVDVKIATNRPNVFIKELLLYTQYLEEKIAASAHDKKPNEQRKLMQFSSTLIDGIQYYKSLIPVFEKAFPTSVEAIKSSLIKSELHLKAIQVGLNEINVPI